MAKNLLIAVMCVVGILQAQSPAARPAFEVATIKPSADSCNGPGRGGPVGPGRLSMACTTVQTLIQLAFGSFANGSGPGPDPLSIHVIGAPKWLESDHYDLVAKAENDAGLLQMAGPMLQTLLEDRLKLKIHRETRQLPVYVLTVAKSGSRLLPIQEGSCSPIDLNHLPTGPPAPGQALNCGSQRTMRKGVDMTVNAYGMSVADFTGQILSGRLDRPVLDKTGLSGLFDFHLQYSVDDATAPGAAAPAADPAGASIFTALQEQLGLKVSPDTGPVEVLVVDHVEKPSEN